MSGAAELVDELRKKGVELSAEGETLRLRAPAGTITAELKTRLRDLKPEVIRLVEGTADDLAESAEILETRVALGAVRVRSRTLARDIWLAIDQQTADGLLAEMRDDETPLPVLLIEDLPGLAGRSPASINALLDTAAVFPGTRFIT